jgi:SPP1 gp7 family putative phage head morphogenesis protein
MRTVEVLRELVTQGLIPMIKGIETQAIVRADATRLDAPQWVPRIKANLTEIRKRWESIALPKFEDEARSASRKVSAQNRATIARQMRSVLGIDVFFGEPELDDMLESFADENTALITNMADTSLAQIEGLVLRGFRGGERAESISKKITERLGVAASRANLIAVDQINKLNGDLTRLRQTKLGIQEYIWRTSRDEAVRPKHRQREGQKFNWDDPPDDGHPGQPVRCRCHADPVIPGREPIKTGPSDVPRARPKPRKPKPVARRRPLDLGDRVKMPRTGEVVTLSPAQRERRNLSSHFLRNPEARAAATSKERRAHLLWQWIHGSKRKTSIELKQAAIQEFGLRGISYNPRGFRIAAADVARTRGDLRKLHNLTQRDLKRRGIKSIRVYRGVRGEVVERGAVESWSTDRKVAEKFAGQTGGKVVVETVPAERILARRGGPEWLDGRFGNQSEVIVLF